MLVLMLAVVFLAIGLGFRAAIGAIIGGLVSLLVVGQLLYDSMVITYVVGPTSVMIISGTFFILTCLLLTIFCFLSATVLYLRTA
jgi:hypothetical protein